jgi:hypothetical protein
VTTIEEASAAVIALLEAVPNLDVFDGAVKARMDSDGRAHPYAVLWSGPGRDNPDEERECGLGSARLWEFQVTAVGGDVARCRRAVDRTLTALLRKRLFADGGLIRLVADPGTEREDRDVTPTRWFVPLVFNVSLP